MVTCLTTRARGLEYERDGASDPQWYLYDGHGSVAGTVQDDGTIVSSRKYDVYGAVRGSTGPSGTSHQYVGALGHASDDETGYIYMRARHYDPITGRFASEDPARDGPNWYAYAGSNAVNAVDRTGKLVDLLITALLEQELQAGQGAVAAAVRQYGVKTIVRAVQKKQAYILGYMIGTYVGAQVAPSGNTIFFACDKGQVVLLDFLDRGHGLGIHIEKIRYIPSGHPKSFDREFVLGIKDGMGL